MAGFFDSEDPFDPSYNLVRARVSRFIEVDNTIPDVLSEGAFERRVARGKWRIVSCSNVKAVIVLEENRPFGGVNRWSEALWFNEIIDSVSGIVGIFVDRILVLDLLFFFFFSERLSSSSDMAGFRRRGKEQLAGGVSCMLGRGG